MLTNIYSLFDTFKLGLLKKKTIFREAYPEKVIQISRFFVDLFKSEYENVLIKRISFLQSAKNHVYLKKKWKELKLSLSFKKQSAELDKTVKLNIRDSISV